MKKFWLVWCPTGYRNPSYCHESYDSALTESKRLADMNPGKEFFVLAALCVAERKGTTVTDLTDDEDYSIPW